MLVAIPTLPLLGAAATSLAADSQVLNGQVQLGNVEASQTLNVDAVSDQTTAQTTATGNTFSGAVETGSVDVQSTQSMQGDASANTELDATTDAGLSVSLTTAAGGNAGEADALGGGALTGSFTQTAGPVSITSGSQINADTAQAGDVTATSNAIANSQGLGATGSSVDVGVTQSSQALTQADGGAILQYTPGTATFSALAVSNNVTATGTAGSTQTLSINQAMSGDRTQAAQFLAIGTGQTLTNAATATANNVSASNDGGALDVITAQDNGGYVRAQAESTAFEFGSSSSIATGVGNAVTATETGDRIVMDNTQTNSGLGIQSIASSYGTDGYDLAGSAVAMGNSVTGSACSICGGSMSIRNSQTNSADVGATSSAGLTGYAPSANVVSGIATAVGNSATFYVSKPAGS